MFRDAARRLARKGRLLPVRARVLAPAAALVALSSVESPKDAPLTLAAAHLDPAGSARAARATRYEPAAHGGSTAAGGAPGEQWLVQGECTLSLSDTPAGWLPENSNTVSHTAAVSPDSARAVVEFELVEASREPGDALNHGTGLGPDLEFRQRDQVDAAVQVISPSTARTAVAVRRATIVTRALDFGAYGAIEARACGAAVRVSLPLDRDGNHIADAWPFGSGAATDDTDDTPSGNGTLGDGLSRYEEYRGFFVAGAHIRTDPTRKDVFVRDIDGIQAGSLGAELLGAPLHFIAKGEWDEDRRINFRYGTAHIADQRAVKIEDGGMPLAAGVWGESFAVDEPWVPAIHVCGKVYVEAIRGSGAELAEAVGPEDAFLPAAGARRYRPSGQTRIEGERISYKGVTGEGFTGVTRGTEGTSAAAHPRGAEVANFTDPDDVIARMFFHELGHAVGLEDSLGASRTCDGTGENIMAEPLCRGAALGEGYWHEFRGSADALAGEFGVRR